MRITGILREIFPRLIGKALFEEAAYAKRLQHLANIAPRWSPEDGEEFLAEEQVARILQLGALNPTSIFGAAAVAITWGQRLGDVQLMDASHVRVRHGGMDPPFVAVTVTEGKTVPTTGPYTLALHLQHPVSSIVMTAAQTPTMWQNLSTAPFHKLFSVDIRALRRTGLSLLAEAGTPTDVLLSMSRHKSLTMLQLYLGSGLHHAQPLHEIGKATMRVATSTWPWEGQCEATINRSGTTAPTETGAKKNSGHYT
jgi:hypothetical protein